MKSKFQKIIWAINPFEKQTALQEQLLNLLGLMSDKLNAEVEPVSVASFENSAETFSLEDFEAHISRIVKEFLGTREIHHLKKPKVVGAEASNHRSAVRALEEYARSQKADLIVVGTQGRKGLPRLFLGSFAETLLLHSEIPVLTVGVDVHLKSQIQNILFATDFKEGSKRTFHFVIDFTKNIKAQMTIFHALHPLAAPSFYTGGWNPDEIYAEELENSLRAVGKAWAAEAESEGVKTQFKMVTNIDSVSEAVIAMAKETQADLIALSAQSGFLESTLIGSVVRQVVRTAHCPVLIMRTGQYN